MTAVAETPGVEIELFSLLEPRRPYAHPAARPWLRRLHRATLGQGVGGIGFWLSRRPRRLLGSIGHLVVVHARRPGGLARALAVVPAAAGHARTMRALEVDRVHAHFANVPAVAAWLCARLLEVPFSVTPHAHDLFVGRPDLGWLVRDAAFVVCISDHHRALLSGYRASTPLPVVRNGVDLDRHVFRERTLPATGPVRVLVIGSLEAYKGHRVLLEALALGRPALARVELDLVGHGSLAGELMGLARRLGLAARVRFHGTCDEDAVLTWLAEADALVLPSVVAENGETEGLPVALVEALAAGVPAVGTEITATPELNRSEPTCLLANPDDAGALADVLEALLRDPAGARARAVAGRRLVEAEFDLRRSAAALAALFGEPAPGPGI